MNTKTCVVIGAGYAGIHAVKEIRSLFGNHAGSHPMRLVLIDRNPYHLRKVLLFRPAVTDEDIRIPLTTLFPDGVKLVQATVTRIRSEERKLVYEDASGAEREIDYDLLVVAAGSVVREPAPAQGGIALASLAHARQIRSAWLANLERAATENDPNERARLMRVAIAGAGISGIETAAELAHHGRKDAERLGLDPSSVSVELYNAHWRLFLDGPAKVGHKLEHYLRELGVDVKHEKRVVKEIDGALTLSDGEERCVGLCIWTLGLKPNPMLRAIGMPVTAEGAAIVDASYRVKDMPGVYAIGDCARIVAPGSGQADGMTCKEAIPQAARIAKVLLADLEDRQAPVHESYMKTFCIGLGPDKGLAWVNKWGLDLVITGKLGWKIKTYTWQMASMLPQ
ncbi:NAD(P)/FAD-dependent oxidoreductase [Paenibacillus sacheonensis]|uniref:NADH:ubiquinone reductase (non-electrogenic) n=1 Tax=Paenibacillus sacheonensis TaxID=742054 RepID=A0A7X5C0N6_9BACL|nr:FAD-dependent oxidoreductase [Paenibacillus sacheonensis]MBM7569483.1 NADH dehydrogenase [Paenibacillus sacheonensis]NBC71927.1 FAD-dependent oxidoreductase [Paenibacillus sacheonensis]